MYVLQSFKKLYKLATVGGNTVLYKLATVGGSNVQLLVFWRTCTISYLEHKNKTENITTIFR